MDAVKCAASPWRIGLSVSKKSAASISMITTRCSTCNYLSDCLTLRSSGCDKEALSGHAVALPYTSK